MDTWGYISTSSASARTGIPSRRTASKNLGQRSSGIVEQKSLFKNLINDKDAVENNYCSRATKLAKIVISPNLSTIMSIDLGSASWSMEALKYRLDLPIIFPVLPWVPRRTLHKSKCDLEDPYKTERTSIQPVKISKVWMDVRNKWKKPLQWPTSGS